MSLKTILATKGGNIVCIEPTADLAAAAKLLSTHRIGALVVLGGDGRLVGILSGARHRAHDGRCRKYRSAAAGCAGDDAKRLHLRRERFGHQRYGPHDERQLSPYAGVDKDRLTGMVSIGDVLKWQIETIRERIHQLELTIDELNLMRL
jgi:CBS domain-containing protein